MRKLLSLSVALVLGLVLSACSKAESAGVETKSAPAYGPGTHDDHKGHEQGPRR